MTRREAAEKVAKLRRLAEKAGTPAEADTARRTADKLCAEHKLTDTELDAGNRANAFDDLLIRLGAYTARHPERSIPMSIVDDLLETARRETRAEDKAKVLEKVVGAVRMAGLFAGSNSTVSRLKAIVDDVLRKHDVRL